MITEAIEADEINAAAALLTALGGVIVAVAGSVAKLFDVGRRLSRTEAATRELEVAIHDLMKRTDTDAEHTAKSVEELGDRMTEALQRYHPENGPMRDGDDAGS